jgi:hypothetical protein
MKTRAKAKRRTSHARHAPASSAHRSHKPSPVHRRHAATEPTSGIQEQGAVDSQSEMSDETNTFTAMETGSPDRDEGSGPLGQEGEGEAQNDQLAALEETAPDEGADI